MKLVSLLSIAASAFLLSSLAIADASPKVVDSGANVVLVTLDGVRWEEVFHGVDPGQSIDPNPEIFSFSLAHWPRKVCSTATANGATASESATPISTACLAIKPSWLSAPALRLQPLRPHPGRDDARAHP